VLVEIEQHARRAAPDECCGLLIARDGRIDQALPARNMAAEPSRRYEIDPKEYLAAIKQCRGTDDIVIGAYHSHPHSKPEPSATDRASAFGDFLYLIAGPVTGPGSFEICAYRLREGNFHSVALVPEPKEQNA